MMWIWTSSGISPLMLRTLLTCAVLGYLAVLGAAAPPPQHFKVPWDWRRSRSQNAKAVLSQRQLPWGVREAPMESASSGWTYPAPPEPEPELEPVSEVQTLNPRPALTPHMAVLCGESEVRLEVSQDLWGTGSLVDPDELLLGDCSHRQFDSWARVVVFQAGLHTCGSQSEMTDDFLIYSFVLQHQPKVSSRVPILRSQDTNVTVQCRYPRHISISSKYLEE